MHVGKLVCRELIDQTRHTLITGQHGTHFEIENEADPVGCAVNLRRKCTRGPGCLTIRMPYLF